MRCLTFRKKLARQDEVLLALMKLRQGLQFQMLVDLFYISRLLASKISKDTLTVLAKELKNFIIFPPGEKLNILLNFQS